MEQLQNSVEKKRKLFKRLREGSKRHRLISSMRGKWSHVCVDVYAREKVMINISGVEPDESHLLGKSDLKYILNYADEKEYIGGGVYTYHFTKMNF